MARRESRRGKDERMNMILNASNLNCRNFVFARDAADIRPHAIFDLRNDPGLAILSAEGEMIMKRRIDSRP